LTFKVFISASILDFAIVEELRKTLGKYGIESVTSKDIPRVKSITQFLSQQIGDCDCFLAIIGIGGTQLNNVNYEISLAISQNKPIIPIAEEGALIPQIIANRQYIVMDRKQPLLSYEHAATYLHELKIKKEQKNAIGGLVLLGLGLLLLGAIVSSD
jgi:hypothetical protein